MIKDTFSGATSSTNTYMQPIIGLVVNGSTPVLSEDGKVAQPVLTGTNLLFEDGVVTSPGQSLGSRELLKAAVIPFITSRLSTYAQTYTTKSRGDETNPQIAKALNTFRGLKTQETMRIVDTVKDFIDPVMTRMGRMKKNQRRATDSIQAQMANMMNWQWYANQQTQALVQNQQQQQAAPATPNNMVAPPPGNTTVNLPQAYQQPGYAGAPPQQQQPYYYPPQQQQPPQQQPWNTPQGYGGYGYAPPGMYGSPYPQYPQPNRPPHRGNRRRPQSNDSDGEDSDNYSDDLSAYQ